MQPVRRKGLIDQVTEQLRREIVSGRWPVGSRIPPEPALSELTGTARNTVREAVRTLVHAGMLERRQGSGTYVLSAADQALCGYFARARDSDLLELRETLEVTAAGLAAERRTDDDVATLTELLARRQELMGSGQAGPAGAAEGQDEPDGPDTDALVAADTAVHRAIVAASHNELYLEFYDSLLPLVAQAIGRHLWSDEGAWDAEHIALVEAVVRGDAATARNAARTLAREVRERVAPPR